MIAVRKSHNSSRIFLFTVFISFAFSSAACFGLGADANEWSTSTSLLAQPSTAADPSVLPGWPKSPVTIAGEKVVSLVQYFRDHVVKETLDQLEAAHDGYNRRDDFGGWINADSAHTCLDTRGQVLVRSADPAVKIDYKDSSECAVARGLWHDPYAGSAIKLAKTMQIDHVVPLKHAYVTGADAWAPERRCFYANFLHNDFHLLAVSGHENMSKSDKAPDQYMPPSAGFQCQYIAAWMKVKTIWGLVSTASELAAIEKVIQTNHCSDSKLQLSEAELAAEQTAIESEMPTRCRDFAQVLANQAPAAAAY